MIVTGSRHFFLSRPVKRAAYSAASSNVECGLVSSVMRRPAVLPLPSAMARLAFGEMAQEALIEGVYAEPARLEQLGYRFLFPELRQSLSFELGLPGEPSASR